MSAIDEKRKLRAFYTAARKNIPANEAEKLSARIARNVFSLPGLLRAELIMVYHKIGSEADMAALVDQILGSGRGVVMPFVREDGTMGVGRICCPREDLEPGPFGTMAPVERLRGNVYPEHIGAIVCPGVAFDETLTRLGRGGGHYDRFLREMRGKAFVVGCGFDCQISGAPLPKESRDAAMDAVVTDKRAFPLGVCPAIKLPDEDDGADVDRYALNNGAVLR